MIKSNDALCWCQHKGEGHVALYGSGFKCLDEDSNGSTISAKERIYDQDDHEVEGEILFGVNTGSRHFISRIDCCS